MSYFNMNLGVMRLISGVLGCVKVEFRKKLC